ncbi:MAG: hypothetical protein HQL38_01900 [Alphaproteobacteria bacterium]|nr:hypothetical protein [Alphaproteobacteria bacterium]
MTANPDWRRAALVLVGHGSARNRFSRIPTERLADALRQRELFAEVHACFWKEAPLAATFLERVSAAEIYVVPNFAGAGILTGEQIPQAMGLTGPLTLRDGRRIHYAEPVGSHPRIPGLALRRVAAIVEANRLPAAEVCLLLIGHGSRRPGVSSATVEATAARLAEICPWQVTTAYLEQTPRVADWPALTDRPYVVAAPLLIAEGLHGSEDLPPLFGLGRGQTGPATIAGRTAWLCRGIGSDPEIAEIILDRVACRTT